MSKNDDNVMVPDISFASSGNDLTLDDIVQAGESNKLTSTSGESSNSSPKSIDDFFSSKPADTRQDEYIQPTEKKQYSLDEIQNVEVNNNTEQQIEAEVRNAAQQPSSDAGENQSDEYDADVYSAALDLIKDYGILNLPDNLQKIDESTLDQLLDYDQQLRNQNALQYVRSKAQDPRLVELFDHVMNGGTYEEAIVIKEVIDDQYNYASLNPQNEEHQRFLLDHYLKEGLNPENPIDRRRLVKVPQEIDDTIANMEGEQLAAEAKQYFINKLEYIKDAQRQQAIEREQLRQQKIFEAQREEESWISDFKYSLNQRPWSHGKKSKVIEQFNIVQLDNGTETELWKYKWNKIWENPQLTHVLMDFLSDLDPYRLEFASKDKTVDKQATNKIMELINNKANSENRFKSSSRYTRQPRDFDSKPKMINPATDF